MKSIEQRTRVESHDVLGCVSRDRSSQLVEIARQSGRVEKKPVACRCNRAFAKRGAKHVDCEVEKPTRAGRVPLWPEQNHGTLAGERLGPGSDNERQQRNAVSLGRWPAERGISGTQGRAPEQLDRDHRLSSAS
jgi:hypothetical protein